MQQRSAQLNRRAESRRADDAWLLGALALVAPVADILLTSSVIRAFVLGPVLLFIPGYALVSVLFPASASPIPEAQRSAPPSKALSSTERIALSIGMSVALLPIVGLALNGLFGQIGGPLIPMLSGITIVLLLLGYKRRLGVSGERRYTPTIDSWVGGIWREFNQASIIGAVLIVLVFVSIAAVTVALGVGLATPPPESPTTTVVLGTGLGDSFQTSGYPTTVSTSEGAEYTLLIENREETRLDYTVVVQLDRIENGAVTETAELDRFDVGIAPGEEIYRPHTVTPEMTGDSLRLSYHLYVEDPGTTPDHDSAYRSTHTWFTAEDPNET